jgi:hypothetical protein
MRDYTGPSRQFIQLQLEQAWQASARKVDPELTQRPHSACWDSAIVLSFPFINQWIG